MTRSQSCPTAEFLGRRGTTLYFSIGGALSISTRFPKMEPLKHGESAVIVANVCNLSTRELAECRINFLKFGRDVDERQFYGADTVNRIAQLQIAAAIAEFDANAANQITRFAVWQNHEVISYIMLSPSQADALNAIPGIGAYFGFDQQCRQYDAAYELNCNIAHYKEDATHAQS